MTTHVKSESQAAIIAALEEKWRGISAPTIDEAFADASAAEDRTLLSLVHEDSSDRRIHRLPFRFADYARVVPGIAGKRHVAKAILAELLRRDRPVDPKAYLDALIGEFPDLECCRDVLESLDEPEPVNLEMPANGRFAALERLGSGGFGTVVRARDRNDGKVVALKLFAPGARSGKEDRALRRFERESRLLGKIDHPGIARVVDFSIADQPPWIALELVDGRDLSFWIDRETIDRRRRGGIDREREAARIKLGLSIFISAARALAAAHRADVLHRDLKPANIILRADGTAVIVDFGLARDLSETEDAVAAPVLSLSREFKGSPPYAPPESIPGHPLRREVDQRSDIYGLAAVFYHFLTLRRPYYGESDTAILDAARRSLPADLEEKNPFVGEDLRRVVQTAMSRFSENRFATADEFADALVDVLHEKSPAIPRPSLTRRLRQIHEENPGVVRLSAALLTILTIGLVATSILLWRNSELVDEVRAGAEHARRASQAEERMSIAVGNARIVAMDLAERQGDWSKFLEISSEVMIDEAIDTPLLCLRRIRAALADRDVSLAAKEMSRLEAMELSPRERADLLLLRGEQMLQAEATESQGREIIRQAITIGLSARADEHYAAGLIDPRTVTAIEHFKAALTVDPGHRRARISLGYMYLLLGDGTAAGNEAAALLAFHPKEPTAYWIGTWASDLREDWAGRERWMSLGREAIGAEKWSYVSTMIEKFDQIRDRVSVGGDQFAVAADQLKRMASAWSQQQTLGEAVSLIEIETPILARFRAIYHQFAECIAASRRDSTNDDLDLFQGIAADHPDGYFLHLAAGAYLQSAQRRYSANPTDLWRDPEIRHEMLAAFRMFGQASQMPSMFKKGSVESLQFRLITGSLIWNWPDEFRPPDLETDLFTTAVDLYARPGLTQNEWSQIVQICLGPYPPPVNTVDLLIRARARHYPNAYPTIEGEVQYHLKFGRTEAARAMIETGRRRFPERKAWAKLEKQLPTIEPESRPAESRPVLR